ncbi:hypothetical protein MAPG_04087 [Magnaporthiopsis poae ATCC 64411]|uniref:alpha-1,2-Mannosidase n=1 Tax=Magnaporthiopsis poae (strain ATCC 64411 / 73-15) TaxID=644358 RepID=A0A0C4DVS6_MAGP6|nr:hypothetical protein MAPG_04087 [Magnaporthiopsis poae ATCC 64411]
MLRIRRYRIFVVGAVILLFLLLRVSQNSQWEARRSAIYNSYAHRGTKDSKPTFSDQKQPSQPVPDAKPEKAPTGPEPRPRPQRKTKLKPKVQVVEEKQPKQPAKHHDAAPVSNKVVIPELKPDPASEPPSRIIKGAPGKAPATTPKAALEDFKIPDREIGRDAGVKQRPLENGQNRLHAANPPSNRQSSVASSSTMSAPHWRKMPEHFPVAKKDVIPLPTGKPKKMPTIQHSFKAESVADREKREGRLAQVKKEMQRAWNGYRKYAWGHDELEPVTMSFRDPFCGWAATLVDAMDTLWIMGMKKEFDDAYGALDNIDFTTTPYRHEIPVFETIIRYLGGLLAAYDVSGGHDGKHPKLLKKAVELAEVLMSVFDTPNRMPVLYYNWMPEYASQPRRASAAAGVAELGTMSMEFTRLAQLTGEDRYYDAIARITNAFEEWQNRGTALDGIFPQRVDATGCNRTAPAMTSLDLSTVDDAESKEKKLGTRAVIQGLDGEGAASDLSGGNAAAARARLPDWDCTPQGLTDGGYGSGSYSMGGSQDSAYEYFPKQYLLLGGLEPKYKTMHLKVVAAVKKYLLYRPMIKDEDRSLLFSASVYANSDAAAAGTKLSYTYEVTHLTCFLGGMFALGGRIFGSAEDLDIGARLADGCVWAYESMPSGLMAEDAAVVPCQTEASCPWNETVWHYHLDSNAEWRDSSVKDYLVRKKEWDEQKASLLKAEALRVKKAEQKAAKRKQPAADSNDPLHRFGDGKDDGQDAGRPRRQLDSDDFTYSQGKAVLNESGREKRGEGSEGSEGNEEPPYDPLWELPPEPSKPQTHEEYVRQRIEQEHLPPGYTAINSKNYILRPEAIESVWYMYRITGDKRWQEKGWRMFKAVIKATQTEHGHSAVDGVQYPDRAPAQLNNMESFWLAETLKYFYLLYTTPDVISLDDWVLNTEAHPFKRPT